MARRLQLPFSRSNSIEDGAALKKTEALLDELKKEAHAFDRELQTGAKEHEHRLEALKKDKALWDATTKKLAAALSPGENDQALLSDVHKIGDSVEEARQKPVTEEWKTDVRNQFRLIDAQSQVMKTALMSAQRESASKCRQGPTQAQQCSVQEAADRELLSHVDHIIREARTDMDKLGS